MPHCSIELARSLRPPIDPMRVFQTSRLAREPSPVLFRFELPDEA